LRHLWLDRNGACPVTPSRPQEPNNNHKEQSGGHFSPSNETDLDKRNSNDHNMQNARRPSQGEPRGQRPNDHHDANINSNSTTDDHSNSAVVCRASETCHADFNADTIPTRMVNTICN
ncbi:unnamed protein product, partial [Allacma fusca]